MGKAATEAQASDHIQGTQERQSRLTKDSTYRDKCSEGFKGPDKPDGRRWEAHHIVCEHSMAARDTNTYVENCLWVSPWNINDPHNLIGLPRNRQFRMEKGVTPGGNWVSHQVDHNTKAGYTEECRGWLQKKVFDTLNKQKKDHKMDADDISDQLKKATDHFKKELEGRAKRVHDTTKKGWDVRFEKAHERTWYHPFSMAEIPRHRSPGVSPSNFLTSVFKLLD